MLYDQLVTKFNDTEGKILNVTELINKFLYASASDKKKFSKKKKKRLIMLIKKLDTARLVKKKIILKKTY